MKVKDIKNIEGKINIMSSEKYIENDILFHRVITANGTEIINEILNVREQQEKLKVLQDRMVILNYKKDRYVNEILNGDLESRVNFIIEFIVTPHYNNYDENYEEVEKEYNELLELVKDLTKIEVKK